MDNKQKLTEQDVEDLLKEDGDSPSYLGKEAIAKILQSSRAEDLELPMLRTIVTKFCYVLQRETIDMLKEEVVNELNGLSYLAFSEYIDFGHIQSIKLVFHISESEELGVLQFNRELLYSFVEILLGSKPNSKSIVLEKQTYSPTEESIINKIAKLILNVMASTINELVPFTLKLVGICDTNRFRNLFEGDLPIICADVKMVLGEYKGGEFNIIMPYKVFSAHKNIFNQVFLGSQLTSDAKWDQFLNQEVHSVDLDLTVALEKEISFQEITGYTEGDIVLFDHYYQEPFDIKCGKHKLFEGILGQHKGQIAFSISNVIKDTE